MRTSELLFPPFLADSQHLRPADNTALFEVTCESLQQLLQSAEPKFWQLAASSTTLSGFLNTYLQHARSDTLLSCQHTPYAVLQAHKRIHAGACTMRLLC